MKVFIGMLSESKCGGTTVWRINILYVIFTIMPELNMQILVVCDDLIPELLNFNQRICNFQLKQKY